MYIDSHKCSKRWWQWGERTQNPRVLCLSESLQLLRFEFMWPKILDWLRSWIKFILIVTRTERILPEASWEAILREGMFKGVYAVHECLHQRDIRDLLLLVPSHPTSRAVRTGPCWARWEFRDRGWNKPVLMELSVCYEVRKEDNWKILHTSSSLTLLSPIRGHKGRAPWTLPLGLRGSS